MLVRLVVENFMSVGGQRELTTVANERLQRLRHHVYAESDTRLLKLLMLYGANGSGKSTLVGAIGSLSSLVKSEAPWAMYHKLVHRSVREARQPITLGVEYMIGHEMFLYALQLGPASILAEELYRSDVHGDDQLLFARTSQNESSTLDIPLLENRSDKESVLSTIQSVAVRKDVTLFKTLTQLRRPELAIITRALTWFTETLNVITPHQYAVGLAERIDTDHRFRTFVRRVLQSSHLNVEDVNVERLTLTEFYGRDDLAKINETRALLESNPEGIINAYGSYGNPVSIVLEDHEPIVKLLVIIRKKGGKRIEFNVEDESEGTQRLLDFLPAFYEVLHRKRVFIIDEIERSLHPALIKELLTKFSLDPTTHGQLIVTTHESNLLDQEILRRDEIWFVEKDSDGATDLHSLNRFREHHTIDIRKGYLNGRYGGIPFLGNLHDLNWNQYDSEPEPVV